ncbi:MAG: hypothetical protein ABIM50_01715 [Novosphingobium sp.]
MRKQLIATLFAGALSVTACAGNYAGEGALVKGAVGAGVGAVTDGNVGRGAAIGAAAGAVGGALIKKNGRCYRTDRNGDEYQVRC